MSACLKYQCIAQSREEIRIPKSWNIIIGILRILALGTKVSVKHEVVTLGYELGAARSKAIQLSMLKQEHELALSVTTRPDKLKKLAFERLGLREASPEQVFILK